MSLPSELFRDAKLKIKRAHEHIEQLPILLGAFLESRPYKLDVKHDPKTGYNFIEFETTQPLPPAIPLTIGDALHNLRAALDYAFWEIVLCTTKQLPSQYVSFPCLKTREKLEAALKSRDIEAAGPDIIDLIRNEIKPYPGGNDPLWALHRLDIADKHRLLITVLRVLSLRDVSAEDENHNRFTPRTLAIAGDGILRPFGTDSPLHIQSYGEPTIGVLFGKGEEFFPGEPVIPTFVNLAQVVTSIMDKFTNKLLARIQGGGHTPPASGSHPATT